MTVLPVPFGLIPFGVPRDHRGLGGRSARPTLAPGPGVLAAVTGGRIFRGSESRRRTGQRNGQIVEHEHEITDEALLGRYLDGDRSAYRTLVGRYHDELTNFLTRFLGSRAAAEDVFQETFLQVHLSAETFDLERRLRPWLFTIAANKARDYHRKNTKRAALSLSASIGDEGGQRFVDLMEADLPGPDAPVLDAERSRLVKSVIDDMPAHLREILLLSYFQKMSYNQIAETLGIPLGTVKSRLHTAVAAFARSWTASRVEDDSQDGRP